MMLFAALLAFHMKQPPPMYIDVHSSGIPVAQTTCWLGEAFPGKKQYRPPLIIRTADDGDDDHEPDCDDPGEDDPDMDLDVWAT